VILAMALSGVLAMVGCANSNSSSSGTGSNITATPTFSPGAGTYNVSKTVTIGDATQGAVLYCTTDGTTPTTSSPQCSLPTTVFKSEFLQAIAVAPGKAASAVASAGYTISPNAVATPTFSPAGGPYTGPQTVTINESTSGAIVYYTLDGTAPSANSTLYAGPVSISQTATLSAIAVAAAFADSPIVTATYTIQLVLPAPTISGINPASANAGGAALALAVSGANFVSNSTVQWNGAALATTYGSATQLTATVPASLIASAGTANVTVAQTSDVSAPATFTINAVTPTITGVNPSSGAAGTSVTITGTNFTGATAVNFGGTPAISFTVNSATSITAVSPAGTGTVDVSVVAPNGTSPAVAADRFTYINVVPTLSGISPAAGATTGGTSVTITGASFTGATAVNFGTTPATSFTVNSATSITAISPAGTGTVDAGRHQCDCRSRSIHLFLYCSNTDRHQSRHRPVGRRYLCNHHRNKFYRRDRGQF
jgi:Chitobiase/beta-hexosaminidase C-terminal domain/IPT/TIG domain